MAFLHPCQRKNKQGASSAPDIVKGSMQTASLAGTRATKQLYNYPK